MEDIIFSVAALTGISDDIITMVRGHEVINFYYGDGYTCAGLPIELLQEGMLVRVTLEIVGSPPPRYVNALMDKV